MKKIWNLINSWLKLHSKVIAEGLLYYAFVFPLHLSIIAYIAEYNKIIQKSVYFSIFVIFFETFLIVIVIACCLISIGVFSAIKVVLVFLLVVDLVISVSLIRVTKHITTFIGIIMFLDFILSFWLASSTKSIKNSFSTIERTKTVTITYGEKTVEKVVKTTTYPVLLPILIAIISASGTVIVHFWKS